MKRTLYIIYVWLVPALALWNLAIAILSRFEPFHTWIWNNINPDLNVLLFISLMLFFIAMFVGQTVKRLEL
jgi:hypothetical protein